MNAVGRRLSESRVRENLMHGLRWQAMETETTAPSLDPTRTRLGNEEVYSRTARVSIVRWNLKEAEGKPLTRRTEISLGYETRMRSQYRLKSNNCTERK